MTSPEVEDIKRYMDEVVAEIRAEIRAIMVPVLAQQSAWRRARRAGGGEEPTREP